MNPVLEIALQEYGVKEIPGPVHNNRIVQYAKEVGMSSIDNDETSWCSVFVNWCAFRAGYEYTRSASARSWLSIGEEIYIPRLGDIVVFWRESLSSWKGHVGIFIAQNENTVFCLGGNQGDKVQISEYDKTKVLGYRRLKPML